MSDPPPHPRDATDWLGPAGHEQVFLDALSRGRLPHAWLVSGPEGVGKATFAYRAARRLLGALPDSQDGPLGSMDDDPVVRQIKGRAHPDLLVLQRDAEDGKNRRNIPVDEARNLSEFFSKSPAAAPYRVAIVDTADDLGAGAANALLKTMEEPPPRGVILMLSALPGALLPTIRSRCRRLEIRGPDLATAAPWVAKRADLGLEEASRLLELARGAPGGAWRLASTGALDAEASVTRLMANLRNPDEALELSLADSFRGVQGANRFRLIFACLAEQVRRKSLAKAAAGEPSVTLDAWSRAWSELNELQSRVESVNLDRGEAFLITLSRLRAIA